MISIYVSDLFEDYLKDFPHIISDMADKFDIAHSDELGELLQRGWWNSVKNRYCIAPPLHSVCMDEENGWWCYLAQVEALDQKTARALKRWRFEINNIPVP